MSTFWSVWVMGLIALNLGISLALFWWAQRVEIPTAPDGTSGHAWAHGVLREGVRRLPRWWVVFSGAMFVAAFVYLALYPGFGAFRGVLGWTSEAEWREDTAANSAKLEPVLEQLRAAGVAELAADRDAAALGRRVFLDNCAACHGQQGRGNQAVGAPDLMDADWLYGGEPAAVLTSILDGRRGVMPPWGEALGADGLVDVVSYVRSLSGAEAPQEWIEAGKARYATLCAACHGVDGRGMAALGAPNLTDGAWLYGGDFTSVLESIRDGRGGEMPAWRERLDEGEVRAVAAWLHATGERVRAKER